MIEKADELPSGAGELARAHPGIWKAHSALGEACADAGPISGKRFAWSSSHWRSGPRQGAVHSHVRRALEEDVSTDELKHVALLAIPTLGLPQAVKVLTWIEDVTNKR